MLKNDPTLSPQLTEVIRKDEDLISGQFETFAPTFGKLIERLARLVRFGFTLIGWAIVARIFFSLIAANPNTGFGELIYTFTDPLVAPFAELVSNPSVMTSDIEVLRDIGNPEGIIEYTSMIAVIVYWIAGGLVARLIRLLFASLEATGQPIDSI